MAERSQYQVLFVRRKPRMFGAIHGPIRHDAGTVMLHRDYVEMTGSGVRYAGLRAARIVVPCILFLPASVGAVIVYILMRCALTDRMRIIIPYVILVPIAIGVITAYLLVEYALIKPMRLTIPLIHIRRVLLDPLRGTVMIAESPEPGRPATWHSFATAYAWAIFDRLEPLLTPGTCSLTTRRDRALARGDLAVFLAVCSLTPVVGIAASLSGIAAGMLSAILGERRYGLVAAALCLATLIGQGFLIHWWISQ